MADSSVTRAKKEIVASLLKLRGILTSGSQREYPRGLGEHPEVMKVLSEIETSYARHFPSGDWNVQDFLTCYVLPLKRLPLRPRAPDRDYLDSLDNWIEEFGGQVPAANQGGGRDAKMSEPLTRRAEAVYNYIVADGPVFGWQITQKTGIDQSTLTKEIIPELKRLRQIVNKRGAGYYSPDHYSPH